MKTSLVSLFALAAFDQPARAAQRRLDRQRRHLRHGVNHDPQRDDPPLRPVRLACMMPGRANGHLFLVALALFSSRCADVPATNPYDPATPVAQQARGSVLGTLRLPEGYGAERLAQATITARAASAPELLPQPTSVASDGRFRIVGLASDTYAVEVSAEGLVAPVRWVFVALGQTVQMGVLDLAPRKERGQVHGSILLEGAPAQGHGGTVIDAKDTPYLAATAPDGRFLLELPHGRYTLRLSHPGYTTVEPPEITVGDAATAPLDVVLEGRPGSVRGVARLRRFGGDRITQTSVSLTREGDVPRTVGPSVDGVFQFDEVPAGAYQLGAALPGFDPYSAPLVVSAGQPSDAGTVTLEHASDGPAAVFLAGDVWLEEGSHEGTRVRATIAGADLPFRDAVTDASGAFQLPAARDERYVLAIEHVGFEGREAGPYAWNGTEFVDSRGESARMTLPAAPFSGRITVPVDVRPAWLPLSERHARVSVRALGADLAREVVPTGETVTFSGLPAGTAVVSVERRGFSVAEQLVVLGGAADTIQLTPQVITLTDLALARLDLSGQDISACDLRGLELRGAQLAGVHLSGSLGSSPADCPRCDAAHPELCEALDLTGAELTGLQRVTGASLDMVGAILRRANLAGAVLPGVDLSGADLLGAVLLGADLSGARLVGADLRQANLSSGNLQGARFADAGDPLPTPPCFAADRPAALLEGAILGGADLSGALMAGLMLFGVDLGSALLTGADLRHACMREARLALGDLTGADLSGADLAGGRLSGAVLSEARLRGADLTAARLSGTLLDLADLGCAREDEDGDCACPSFEELGPALDACLGPDAGPDCGCRTSLRLANLSGATLVGTTLAGADLAGATLIGVAFGDADRAPEHQPTDCELPPGVVWEALDPELNPHILFGEGCAVQRSDLRGARLDGVRMSEVTLDHVDLSGASVQGSLLDGTHFVDVTLDGANLSRSSFDRADLRRQTARGVRFVSSSLAAADLRHADLAGADLSGARLFEADLGSASLKGAVLVGADLSLARLDATDLSDADARRGTFILAVVSEGTLEGARLDGADLRRSRITETRLDQASLDGARLDESTLERVFGNGVSMRGAVVHNAVLSECGFSGGDLSGSSFSLSRLTDVRFEDVELVGAAFDSVDLTRVMFPGAALDGASFASAVANFAAVCAQYQAAIEPRLAPGAVVDWLRCVGPAEPCVAWDLRSCDAQCRSGPGCVEACLAQAIWCTDGTCLFGQCRDRCNAARPCADPTLDCEPIQTCTDWGGRLCTQAGRPENVCQPGACARQADCPRGTACSLLLATDGSRLIVDRCLPAGPGQGGVGSACGADADCLSGLCDPGPGQCTGPCDTSADCGGGICRLLILTDLDAGAIDAPHHLCFPSPGSRTSCDRDGDCPGGERCEPLVDATLRGGDYATPPVLEGICVATDPQAGAPGAACGDSPESVCQVPALCLGSDAGGRCSALCATSADCPEGMRCENQELYRLNQPSGEVASLRHPVCRPAARGSDLRECAASRDCGANQGCVGAAVGQGALEWLCESTAGATPDGQACLENATCRSGRCLRRGAGAGLCVGPCETTEECPAATICAEWPVAGDESTARLCVPVVTCAACDPASGQGCLDDEVCSIVFLPTGPAGRCLEACAEPTGDCPDDFVCMPVRGADLLTMDGISVCGPRAPDVPCP